MSRPGRRGFALITVGLALATIFMAYRWSMRVEPLNSDDVILFGFGVEAAEGRHWLGTPGPLKSLPHSAMRIGILPFLVTAISVWGPTYSAYAAVSLSLACLGFLLVWGITSREVDPLTAILVAAFHLALPFELKDGGILLVDLPSGVFSILSLLLVEWAADRARSSTRWLGGTLAGLAAVEAYLLRTNSLILLLPALAVLAFHRRRRIPVAAASAVLAGGFLLEQLLLLSRGFDFGYRWTAVRRALESFERFLPRYPPGEFWNRQFTALWESFGGGFAGTFAVGCYLGFLAALVAMLVRARSPLLRALAVFGLATYGAFAYGFSAWSDGLIHALAPPLYRYFQPFYYTGLVALAWVLGSWRHRLERRHESRRWLPWTAVAGVASFLAVSAFAISAEWLPRRMADPCGELNQALCAIDRAAAEGAATPTILTTDRSARLMGLLRGTWSEPPVRWLVVPSDEMVVHLNRADWIFLDWRRLVKSRRYHSQAGRLAYDERLDHLLEELSDDFVLRKETPRFRLLHRSEEAAGFRPVPHGTFDSVNSTAERVEGWQTTIPLDIEPAEVGGVVLRLAPGTNAYLFSGGGGGMRHPPTPAARYALDPEAAGHLGFRVRLDLPPGASAALFLLQYDNEERVATERLPLRSGSSYVRLPVADGARTYRVGIRVGTTEEAGSAVPVTVREVAFRPEPFGDLCPCPR